ncbi:doublecortin domain-containing protein 1-like isoform X1 [Mobula birostris]|uniref:doublecortin domain-containing protein 1-like isoform X1 n=1 Tax=Mobula birostris TaxID=1983395 RepID=UPI003B28648E
MGRAQRPNSAGTSTSKMSGTMASCSMMYTSSLPSQCSSLEDALVQEYIKEISKGSSSSPLRLPRKCGSPYERAIRMHSGKPSFRSTVGFHTCSQSRRRRMHSSFESYHTVSACKSNISTHKKKCRLRLPKIKRGLSAPSGSVRKVHSSLSSRLLTACRDCKQKPLSKHQETIIKVTAFKNGTHNISAKLAVLNFNLLLEESTIKLKLNSAARRVFLANGQEAFEPKDIPHNVDVYISTGEPFIDPFKNIKDHLSLAKRVSWTMKGIELPSDRQHGRTKPILSRRLKKLIENGAVRILVFKNGAGQDGDEITTSLDDQQQFLDQCTLKINLMSPAKYLYDWEGNRIYDLRTVPLLDKCLQNSITPLRGPVWVSKGEGFILSGSTAYIQGIIKAINQKLKAARNYRKQVYHALNGCAEKVSNKNLLSMTTGELYKISENLDNLIDELRATLKKHNSQLSKLSPLLQAEKGHYSGFVDQHINTLSASSTLSKGLHIKVYQNGWNTGEISMFIKMKTIEKGSGNNKFMMDQLLQIICQKLKYSPGCYSSGLNLSPTRLFDEKGHEIRNPLSLENGQKVWVSYGEEYRSFSKPFLCVMFDCVRGVMNQGQKMVYKTPLEYDGPLNGLEKSETWEVCTGFPEKYNWIQMNESSQEKVEMIDKHHFLQFKNDPQVVVYPLVTTENRSENTLPAKKEQKKSKVSVGVSRCFSAHIWAVTKSGMISCRAYPQLCLAVSDQQIRLKNEDDVDLEGYELVVQKRMKQSPQQLWGFNTAGNIYSMAYPKMVLTYLGDLKMRADEEHTEHQVSADSPRKGRHKPVSRASEVQLISGGSLEVDTQLTVALLTKLEEKHPWTPAQRWAIKQEGIAKPGQWKKSKQENALWNKLTYMWPLMPDGELNGEYDWPIEGSLLPNAPPLKNQEQKSQEVYAPVRLKVLKNGEQDKSRALKVTGPDITSMPRKTCNSTKNKDQRRRSHELQMRTDTQEGNRTKAHQLEFQQFLERCTSVLGLPLAARRLFDESGQEWSLLTDLQRDQLVYVSCGEAWIDPKVISVEQKKRLCFTSLTSDVAMIRAYCATCNPQGLVLEVVGNLVAGARLALAECAVPTDCEDVCFESDKPDQTFSLTTDEGLSKDESLFHDLLDAHARAHLILDAQPPKGLYPWERNSKAFDNDEVTEQEDGRSYTSMDLYNKCRPQIKPPQKLHQQQFQFQDGYIVNCSCPWLVVGVPEMSAHQGTEVILVERKADDIFQRWKLKEENRTLHLMGNPDVVLAVSMPQVNTGNGRTVMEFQGRPVILQIYKEHSNGVANQKWSWEPKMKILCAFSTSILDNEITAANHTNVCTFCICRTQEMDQPGYYFTHPSTKQRTVVCLACARTLRGRNVMTKLQPGVPFTCATGCKESQLKATGPFKYIRVTKVDLSTSAAKSSLAHLEAKLNSLRMETSVQTISWEISAAKTQPAIRILAYRNGAGYKDGELIIGTTFSSLLAMCTQKLKLTRPAHRLYTADGSLILTVSELIAGAGNDCLQEQEPEITCAEEDKDSSKLLSPHLVTCKELKISPNTRKPIEVWVSCGEPFIPLSESNKRLRMQRKQWLQKEKVLSDLDMMKHKIRHLQGRRVGSMDPANMVPTKCPVQPVVVEGGWTEPSPEELRLTEDVQNMEMHLSEVQNMLMKERSSVLSKMVSNQRLLYSQPNVKRVLAYLNGDYPDQGVYAWGTTIPELLESCTMQLKLRSAAKILFSPDGEQITSWERIERDTLVCVSQGEPFLTSAESRQRVEIRANYARMRKEYGQDVTNIVIKSGINLKSQAEAPSPFLALLPGRDINE